MIALVATAIAIDSRLGTAFHPSARPSPMVAARPDQDAEHASRHAQHDRLDEELDEDVALARADRQADADLARPLGDADQHDVHHADAADHEAHRRDRQEERGEHGRDRLLRLAELGLRVDDEVGVLALRDAMALPQDRRDLLLRARRSSDPTSSSP